MKCTNQYYLVSKEIPMFLSLSPFALMKTIGSPLLLSSMLNTTER